MPETLAQAGIHPQQVRQSADSLITAALADPCCATNPVHPDGKMVRLVLQQVTGVG